jgi:nitronate monooxygenase
MMRRAEILRRAEAFAARFGLKVPILLAPMAGVLAPALSIAIAKAGGLGACGVLLMQPAEIAGWAAEVRAAGASAFQLNIWVPEAEPRRDPAHEADVRDFLAKWGPAVPASAGDAQPPDFAQQWESMLLAEPPVVSSMMGLYPPDMVRQLKQRGMAWFACATTVAEARAAEAAGADIIVAQGAEAGGHRGTFDARAAEAVQTGTFALLPAVVDAVRVPVVATGGIADARGIAAALLLGASAVQIGTGFLRCPEAALDPAWADALAQASPEDTVVSRVFSGRAGRSLANDYVRAATAPGAPLPAPYPVQRSLTAAMRALARKTNDLSRTQAWAGQAARLAPAEPAAIMTRRLWDEVRDLLV